MTTRAPLARTLRAHHDELKRCLMRPTCCESIRCCETAPKCPTMLQGCTPPLQQKLRSGPEPHLARRHQLLVLVTLTFLSILTTITMTSSSSPPSLARTSSGSSSSHFAPEANHSLAWLSRPIVRVKAGLQNSTRPFAPLLPSFLSLLTPALCTPTPSNSQCFSEKPAKSRLLTRRTQTT